jgi:hypothetical protein
MRIDLLFVMFPVAPDLSGGEMKEMNDRARAANKCCRENGGEGEKKCDFGEKIAARFEAEVFATDVKERRRRTAGGAAVITIQREDLKIAIGHRKPGSGSPSTEIPVSPTIVSFGVGFHRLLTFFLWDAARLKLGFNIPTKSVAAKYQLGWSKKKRPALRENE